MGLMRSKISSQKVLRDVVLNARKVKAEEAVTMGIVDSVWDGPGETVEAALKLGEELGKRKWHGEVYAEIRKDSLQEACHVLGLVAKGVVVARL
ncbi:hypothetical protein GIB67_035831 [Kingdonia uniflora]|uniref:Uncharacterized protein n=1 Tax=Kingdonia uniflora TaxID=39325 RepID=A0A7J7MJW6_9MAGN|nr:hypothetical protein GIB67_035831 [Kingdonia uniflora]